MPVLSERMRSSLRTLGTTSAVLLALAVSSGAFADALVTSVRGSVRADRLPLHVGHRISGRTTIDTARNAQIILQFDDGSMVLLEENSLFRIIDYKNQRAGAAGDRSISELVRGAGRFVSGGIARRDPDAYELRTPQGILSVRGTDFMLAIVNPLYIHVLEGAVAANTAAGTVVFTAGSVGLLTNAYVLPAALPQGSVPPMASGTFVRLQSVALRGGWLAPIAGSAMGAGPATLAAPTVSRGVIVGIAAAAALIAVAAGGGGSAGTTTSGAATQH